MRVAANWNVFRYDQEFENLSIDRLWEVAGAVVKNVRSKCPIGTESRPMYKKGRYAGQPWTARDRGELYRSVRRVRKFSRTGKPLKRKNNVRVYVGNYMAYYARIVEFYKPFFRSQFYASEAELRSILGVK